MPKLAFTLDHAGIGADLKRVRTTLNLSIADVAKDAGIAGSHVWNLENGVKEMSLEKFFRLCAVLCVPSGQILADNLQVDRELFFLRALEGLLPQFADSNLAAFIADYIAGCASIIAYLLLAPEFSERSFAYPTKTLDEAFRGVALKIKTLSLRDRRTLLEQLQLNPVKTLEGFGLIKPDMITAFIKEKKPLKKGAPECPPWIPQKSRAFTFPEASSNTLEGIDLVALGSVLKQLQDQQADSLLDIQKLARRKHGRKHSP